MILIDANLLIYAVDRDAPRHAVARRWLEEVFSGGAQVGLAWVVLLAFLRVTTRTGILVRPLDADSALAYVDAWLDLPTVEAVGPGVHHWPVMLNLLRGAGTLGNLTSDAHLAALAIERGATLYSADHDFARFQGLHHVNPLVR